MERNGEANPIYNIELIDIVEYYGVPQLFIAKFKNSESYLVCMLENIDKNKGCMFLGVKVSKERIKSFYQGEIDLRSIFVNSEFGLPFFEVIKEGDNYVAELIPEKILSEEELPEKDYYYEL